MTGQLSSPDAELDLLANYDRLRETQRQINSALVKRLAKATIVESARRLGLWERGKLVVQAEDDFDVVADFGIYDGQPSDPNGVERYRKHRGDDIGPDEAVVLAAMLDHPRLSLFEIVARRDGIGAELEDLVTEERTRVVDRGLAATGRPGLCLATRLLHLGVGGLVMTSGAAIGTDAGVADRLAQDIRAELGRNPREAIRRMGREERSRLAVRILREVLAVPRH